MTASQASALESCILQKSIELAVDHSLQLKEAEARIQMKLSECLQAGLAPNPALLLEFDEIRCSTRRSALGKLESFLGITQLIELGNKRTARQNVVATESSVAMWEWETTKEQLIKKVTDVYIDAFAIHARIKLLDQTLQNAVKLNECLTELLNQGKGSLLLQKKSLLAQNTILNDRKRALSDLASIKRQLVLLCGNEALLNFDELCSTVLVNTFQGTANQAINLHPELSVSAPLPLATYLSLVPNNSELSQLSAIQLAAHYSYHLEKANAVPDVALTVGVENERHYGGCRLLFGFGIEIPVNNRNQGNISRANWEGYAALYKRQDLEREMLARCQDLYSDLQHRYGTIELLSRDLIPTSNEMLKVHSDRELHGKEDCLEALVTYRELFEFQAQYIEEVKEFHHLKASLRLLCGEDL
ncbi:MAG: TolC family protein [Parachlamydiaceae bacterium]|nr:TolC family protein [Parachlamydiaceae bacterium]